ncbi:MAG: anti-sigma factor [Bacteroidia bacterium]
MDIKEYIASGILESYLLGAVSGQEKQEVECLSQIYPEIKQELDEQAKSLESYLASQSISPSSHLRDKIMSQVDHIAQTEQETAQVMVLQKEHESKKQNPYIYWVAAASLIFIIFGYYHFNTKLNEKDRSLSDLKQNVDQLKNQTLSFEMAQTDLEHQLALLKNPDNRLVHLAGTKAHPEAAVMVCWNKSSREVFLSSQQLPAPAADKQYQLWAIVDGKAVDMGVLDIGTFKDHFKKAGAIENAQAFAITLEERGGSPTPHLDQLFVIGNV